MAGPHKTWVPFFGFGYDAIPNGVAQGAGGMLLLSLRALSQPFAEFTVLETRGFGAMTVYTRTGGIRVAWGAEMAFTVGRLQLDSDSYKSGYPADPFCTLSLCAVTFTSAPSDPPFQSKGKRKVKVDEDVHVECNYWWDVNNTSWSLPTFYAVVQGRMLIQY